MRTQAFLFWSVAMTWVALGSQGESLVASEKKPLAAEVNADALYLKARGEIEKGRWAEAELMYREVLKLYEGAKNFEGIARASLDLGVLCAQKGDLACAKVSYVRARDLLSTLKGAINRHNEGFAHHNLALLYAMMGHFSEAAEEHKAALRIWRELDNRAAESESLSGLGFALSKQGDFASALTTLEQARELRRGLPADPGAETDILNNLASVHLGQGRCTEALDLLQQALVLQGQMKDPSKKAEILSNMAGAQATLGRFEEALNNYRQSIEIAQRRGQTSLARQSEVNIASIHTQRGEFQKAIQLLLRLLPGFVENGDLATEAVVCMNLGTTYLQTGDLANARLFLSRGLEFYRGLGNDQELGGILLNLGLLLFREGDLAGAEGHWREALTIGKRVNNPVTCSRALANLANLAALRGDSQAALETAQEAMRLNEEIGHPGDLARLLTVFAESYLQKGDYGKAAEHAIQAIDRARHAGDAPLVSAGYLLKSIAHYLQKDHAAAWSNLEAAVQQIERLGGTITLGELKTSFFDQFSGAYALAVALSLEMGRPEDAFRYAEGARARALLDQIGNQPVNFRRGVSPELLRQEQNQRFSLAALASRLREENRKPLAEQDEKRIERLKLDLEEARTQYASLLAQLKLASPEYATLVSFEPLSLADVQKLVLPSGRTLIEYFVRAPFPGEAGGSQVVAWVIDRERFKLIPLGITAGELAAHVRRLQALIGAREPATPVAAELYESLFAPLVPHIRHRELIIVPHGVLHSLPFAALQSSPSGRSLLDDYTLSYAPSAAAFRFALSRQTPQRGAPLIVGDPNGSLPHAALEATELGRLYGVEPLLGRAATEGAVVSKAAQASLLHLATHGVYNSVNPLFTRVELATDHEHDGSLEMHEVFGLDLTGTRLVVLSSCRTQGGAPSASDELAGLTRAFLYAGVPSVVAALWEVDDESTTLLMRHFHTHLTEGTSKAEALRRAQAETRRRFPHPYHWAAFVLTGDGR